MSITFDTPPTLEFVSADNCGRYFAGSGAEGLIQRCLVVGTSLNHLMNGTDRPNITGEVPPAAFATYHSAFDIRDNIAINFSAVAENLSGVFATNDYYIRPVEFGHIRNTNNLIINAHPGVKLMAPFSYFTFAGAMWDPYGMWGGNVGDYLVYDLPFFTAGQTPTPVIPGEVSGGVLVEGPFYGFNQFVINEGNIRWEDYMSIRVHRLADNFQNLGTWEVDEAQSGWALAHMRHFATHPSDYYQLEFPSIETVSDIGLNVTAMKATDSYQIIAMEYSGDFDIEEVYTSSAFNYLNQNGTPANPTKHIYQAVGCRGDVINSAEGETYWQDIENNLVWIKIRGGIGQFWQPGDYEADSDEELYWAFNLRVRGTEAVCENSHILNAAPINPGNYRAATTIESSGTIEGGIIMNFLAGESITLSEGFHVQNGADFLATIHTCATTSPILEEENKSITERITTNERTELTLKIFPNPIRNNANIQFYLTENMVAQIQVFDYSGRLIQVLNSSLLPKGFHQIEWSGENVEAGIYFIQLQTKLGQQIEKVVKSR